MTFKGFVKDGMLTLPADWPDGEYAITIDVPSTHSQRGYLFGVVYRELSDLTGYQVHELHELCKALFIPPDSKLVDDAARELIIDHPVIGTTTTFSKKSMNKFIFDVECLIYWLTSD
jgi:hypothetical protein